MNAILLRDGKNFFVIFKAGHLQQIAHTLHFFSFKLNSFHALLKVNNLCFKLKYTFFYQRKMS